MNTKICTKCKEEKELSNFSKFTRGKDGLKSWCRDCIGFYNKKRVEKGITKAYQKQIKRKNTLKGVCSDCKQERLTTSKYCLYHFTYRIVSNWRLPKEKIEPTILGLIKKLEDSEYCCHYSGLKITPGFSASIDHRIPQAKGGTHELTNLVWCHKSINSMKGDETEKEFINRSANILVELNYLDSKGEL